MKVSIRVSGQQLDLLWEFLNRNRDLATSHNRSLQAKEFSKRKWREIADCLNSQEDGAHKDWRGWSKYWIDYKGKLKARISKLRLSCRQTRGGISLKCFSDIETKFLKILGENFNQGLPGIQVDPLEPTVVGEDNDSPISESILDTSELSQTLHLIPSALSPTVTFTTDGATPSTSGNVLHPASLSIPRFPRRRFIKREPPMRQDTTRGALLRSSQKHADATVRVAEAMEKMVDVVKEFKNTAERIERFLYAAFPIPYVRNNAVTNSNSSKAV